MNDAIRNRTWAHHLVAGLAAYGIRDIGLSAGSRSTPLVVAFSDHPDMHIRTFFDERAMGFFMMGHTKGSGVPSVILTTSGTAVANLFPSIIEASQSGVPLIVITADRPIEDIGTGANQTIQQVGIFGEYVRHEWDIPCPDDTVVDQWILNSLETCMVHLMGTKPGPVHINMRFRKPLVDYSRLNEPVYLSLPARALPSVSTSVPLQDIDRVIEICSQTSSGLIIVGAIHCHDVSLILALARKLNWPIIADIQSHMRFLDDPLILESGSLLLEQPPDHFALQTCLQFGSPFVSETMLHTLKAHVRDWVFVHPWTTGVDPVEGHTLQIEASISTFYEAVKDRLDSIATPSAWFDQDQLLQSKHTPGLNHPTNTPWNDDTCAHILAQYISDQSVLFCGNSLPIRALNRTGHKRSPKIIECYANRGASGIDGLIASAQGLSLGKRSPVIALIGDLSCLHDLNSLSLLHDLPFPVLLCIINNYGGGIFHHLPIRSYSHVSDYFALHHNWSFEHAAKMFRLPYHAIDSSDSFRHFLSKEIPFTRSLLVECKVAPASKGKPLLGSPFSLF